MENVIIFQETRSLGLFRSDYMVHALESNEIKQVEFNTIASSFAGISSKFHPLHRYFNNYKQNTLTQLFIFVFFFLLSFFCHCFVFYYRPLCISVKTANFSHSQDKTKHLVLYVFTIFSSFLQPFPRKKNLLLSFLFIAFLSLAFFSPLG